MKISNQFKIIYLNKILLNDNFDQKDIENKIKFTFDFDISSDLGYIKAFKILKKELNLINVVEEENFFHNNINAVLAKIGYLEKEKELHIENIDNENANILNLDNEIKHYQNFIDNHEQNKNIKNITKVDEIKDDFNDFNKEMDEISDKTIDDFDIKIVEEEIVEESEMEKELKIGLENFKQPISEAINSIENKDLKNEQIPISTFKNNKSKPKIKSYPKVMWNTDDEVYYIIKKNEFGNYDGLILRNPERHETGQFSDIIDFDAMVDYNGELQDDWNTIINNYEDAKK